MKALKRLLLVVVGLLTVFVVAVFFVASNIDPNDYKQEITQATEKFTGRKLEIAGDIHLTLFPVLSLELGQVSLANPGNPPGSKGTLASAERVHAELALLPLLQKRLDIGRITLHRPQLGDDGKPLDLTLNTDATIDLAQDKATFDSLRIAVAGARIEGGGSISRLSSKAPEVEMDFESNRIDLIALVDALANTSADALADTKSIPVSDLQLKIRAHNKKADILIPQAKIFGGRFNGNLSVATGAGKLRWQGSGKANGIKIEQALAVLGEKRLQGTGTLSYELKASGDNKQTLLQSLTGTASVVLEKGVLKTPGFARNLKRVAAHFKERIDADAADGEVIFDKLSASFVLDRGVADNRDFEGDLLLFHLQGAGRVDLPRSRINYQLRAGLLGEKKDQRVYIPIKITGTFNDPKYRIDFEEVLREEVEQLERGLKKKVEKEKKRLEEKAKDKIEELLKDKLKLPF